MPILFSMPDIPKTFCNIILTSCVLIHEKPKCIEILLHQRFLLPLLVITFDHLIRADFVHYLTMKGCPIGCCPAVDNIIIYIFVYLPMLELLMQKKNPIPYH